MADSILKIHTQDGDKPISYSGLAGKPESDKTLSIDGAFADAAATGEAIDGLKGDFQEELKKKANGQGITLSVNEAGGLRVTYDDGK